MKSKLFLFTFLLFSTQLFSQHSIFIEGGNKYPVENMYLSNGPAVELGYRYNFHKNYIINASFSINTFAQNPSYSFHKEPYISEYTLSLWPEGQEIILHSNFNINIAGGVVFLKKFFIQPTLLLGVSGNYTYHRYDYLTIDNENRPIESINVDKSKYNIGFWGAAGFFVKISNKIMLQGFANYNTQPFVEIGIQKKTINSWGWQTGISFVL